MAGLDILPRHEGDQQTVKFPLMNTILFLPSKSSYLVREGTGM